MHREPWYYAGVVGGVSNGALIRMAPVVVTQFINPSENIYEDAVLATMLIHNSALAIGSSITFVMMLDEFIRRGNPPQESLFVEEFAEVLGAFTGGRKVKLRKWGGDEEGHGCEGV